MPRSLINSGKPERLAVLTLVVLGLIAYVNCLSSEFVFDDVVVIDSRTLDAHSLNWLVPNADLPIKGRPLVGLTFVANYALWRAEPAGYHLFNMAVHVACAVALFGTVRQALLRWTVWAGGNHEGTGVAFACALLWMVHPLQTECVNYVSQRTESMAALFILASLYCAIRSWEAQQRGRWIVAAGVASWAGVLCKEIAFVGPLLIVLLDVTFAGRSIRTVVRGRWPVYVTTFSSWVPLAGLLYFLPRSASVGPSGEVTVLLYALNQSILLVQYLRLIVWPDVLLIDYGRPSDVSWAEALPAVLAVLSLLALTLAVYRRCPVAGFLGVASFLLLAPTSSILPINSEVGAERRMYLPLAAIMLLLVLGVRGIAQRCFEHFARRGKFPWVERLVGAQKLPTQTVLLATLLAAVGLALGSRTFDRNGEYAEPYELWTQAAKAYPENKRAWAWQVLELSPVDPAAAERLSAEMASRWSDDLDTLFWVADVHLRLHHNTAAAYQYYRRVVEIAPSHKTANLRLVWVLAGCADVDLRDGSEALRIARGLQAKYPRSPEILDALAIAQAECGDFESAIAAAEAAIANAEAEGSSVVTIEQRIERYRQGRPFRFNEI